MPNTTLCYTAWLNVCTFVETERDLFHLASTSTTLFEIAGVESVWWHRAIRIPSPRRLFHGGDDNSSDNKDDALAQYDQLRSVPLPSPNSSLLKLTEAFLLTDQTALPFAFDRLRQKPNRLFAANVASALLTMCGNALYHQNSKDFIDAIIEASPSSSLRTSKKVWWRLLCDELNLFDKDSKPMVNARAPFKELLDIEFARISPPRDAASAEPCRYHLACELLFLLQRRASEAIHMRNTVRALLRSTMAAGASLLLFLGVRTLASGSTTTSVSLNGSVVDPPSVGQIGFLARFGALVQQHMALVPYVEHDPDVVDLEPFIVGVGIPLILAVDAYVAYENGTGGADTVHVGRQLLDSNRFLFGQQATSAAVADPSARQGRRAQHAEAQREFAKTVARRQRSSRNQPLHFFAAQAAIDVVCSVLDYLSARWLMSAGCVVTIPISAGLVILWRLVSLNWAVGLGGSVLDGCSYRGMMVLNALWPQLLIAMRRASFVRMFENSAGPKVVVRTMSRFFVESVLANVVIRALGEQKSSFQAGAAVVGVAVAAAVLNAVRIGIRLQNPFFLRGGRWNC